MCWIIKDNRPAEIVSGEGFKYFMKMALPRYYVPHRTTLQRNIAKLYDYAVIHLKSKFAIITYFAITSDAWTDSMNHRSYLGMTLHYIGDFKHHSITIGMVQLHIT